jgi:hypothetical protein
MKLHKMFFQKYETDEIMIINFAVQLELQASTVAKWFWIVCTSLDPSMWTHELNYIILLDYKLELPKCDTNGTRLTELDVCAIGK